MCVVCKLWQTGKLTDQEAKAALWELIQDQEQDELHIQKLYSEIEEKDAE